MTKGKRKNDASGERLEIERRRLGVSQRALAMDLGIDQGHYSKLVRGVAPDGKRYIERGLRLLIPLKTPGPSVDELVSAAAKRMRTSLAFRRLVEAALQVQSDS